MLGNVIISHVHISTKSQPTFILLSTDKMLGKKVCCVLQCPWQVIGFDNLDHISGVLEKFFCLAMLGALETSLKDVFSLTLSEIHRVTSNRVMETAKVKETMKQVQFHKSKFHKNKILLAQLVFVVAAF